MDEEIREIKKFGAKWDLDEHEGYIWLKDSEGNLFEEKVTKAQELMLLLHILRNEPEVFYNTVEHYISTSMEKTGE